MIANIHNLHFKINPNQPWKIFTMISSALNPQSSELQLTSFTMVFSKQLQIMLHLYKALFTLAALKALPRETHKHK